jgi:site-specific DNA-methyltransferase (adenine-specific)
MLNPYFSDGGQAIYLGHCRSVLPELPRPDVVITDPPYNAETHSKVQSQSNGIQNGSVDFPSMGQGDILNILEIANPLRWCVFTCAWQHVLGFSRSTKLRFVRMGVWVKPDGCPQFTGDRPAMGWEAVSIMHGKDVPLRWNGGGSRAVWTYHVGRNSQHPTEKPLGLLYDWINAFTEEGETVLDPFCGSGTTLRACKDLSRKCIGIEIREEYAEMAANRLRQEILPLSFAQTSK